MENDLNLYIMSAEEVVNWYRPQTEVEKYLVNLLSENSIINKLENQIDNLEDDLSTLQCKYDDCNEENENLESEIKQLNKKIIKLNDEIDELKLTKVKT